MDTPSRDEFEDLKRQVEQMTAVMRHQAMAQQHLAAFAAPLPRRDDDREYTRQEACELLVIGRTKFDDTRKLLKIRPAKMVGRRPLFSQRQIDQMQQHLQDE